MTESEKGILKLTGVDGGNPLGFLAALGTLVTAERAWPGVRMHWVSDAGFWRPALSGCGSDPERFIERLHATLQGIGMKPFEVDGKLPFAVEIYAAALRDAVGSATAQERRDCDLLCGFGTDIEPKADAKKVLVFQDSRLRMVRSGDAAGQGLPVYAKSARESAGPDHLRRTLFEPWDYRDSGFSLRWDPIEDQRYALRWRDPSKSGSADGPGIMLGANSLAVEALQLLPTIATAHGVETTGFHSVRRKGTFLTWPIWEAPAGLPTVRSLLALASLQKDTVDRQALQAMGVVDVFRAQRIQQSQYYSNFAPAVGV